jgi:hypothetical protein
MRYPIAATLFLAVTTGLAVGAAADAERKATREAEVNAVLIGECVAKRAGSVSEQPLDESCRREIVAQAAARKSSESERAAPTAR